MAHILIVDDDPSFVGNCTQVLRHDGFDVTATESVASAVKALELRATHALLLDWKLPDGTGLDVLHWLASKGRHIPAAFITGFWFHNDCEAAVATAKQLGVAAYLRRGIDLDDPSEIVRRLLDPLAELHSAVLRGDEAARELLTAKLWQHIVPRLRTRSHPVSVEMATDAVTDAIVRHLANPTMFNPIRHVSIDHYIWVAARRNLSNAIRAQRRDLVRDTEYAKLLRTAVADPFASRDSEPRQLLHSLLKTESDPHTRFALGAWLDGDHSSVPWRKLPALATLSPSEMAREIKRHKDRFIARAKRSRSYRQQRRQGRGRTAVLSADTSKK